MNSSTASLEKTPEPRLRSWRKHSVFTQGRAVASQIHEAPVVSQAAGNLATQRLLRPSVIQAKLTINPPSDRYEHEADRMVEQVASGKDIQPGERGLSTPGRMLQQKSEGTMGQSRGSLPDGLPADAGQPLSAVTRRFAEPALSANFEHVHLHDSPTARLTAAMLGARAFTHGQHVWLGPNESESDRLLMAHELAHVLQQGEGIYLRQATWLERRAWLGFFDHYLPRKFLNNYMDDTGASVTLTQQEMMDVNPVVNITRSPGFTKELAALQAQVRAGATSGTPAPATNYIEVQGPGQALTNGTLGNFTVKYKGTLTVTTTGEWTFVGTMCFYDIWDFDPKPFGTSGRSTIGEIKTRVASAGLPGKPFDIFSMEAPLVQTGSDPQAVWAGGTPTFVNDKAGRAGADIAVGDVGGGDIGAETGAQAAEDLNP